MIDPRAFRPLMLDQEGICRLLPHRAPILLVDGVTAMADAPPALRAFKHITLDEPVLAGHFPTQPLWPAVYSIEGLAQTCALLGALRAAASVGVGVGVDGRAGIVVIAAADVKFTLPVHPGQRLDYLVVLTHTIGPVFRFDVEATVATRVVARGRLTLAVPT